MHEAIANHELVQDWYVRRQKMKKINSHLVFLFRFGVGNNYW